MDLLEALQESRKEAAAENESTDEKDSTRPMGPRPPKLEKGKRPLMSTGNTSSPQGWIGNGTIPAVDYMDLSKPPPLPVRPSAAPAASLTPATSLELKETALSSSSPRKLSPSPVPAAASSPGTSLTKESSRGSSPERRKFMLTTLRQKKDPKKPKYKSSSSSRSGTRPAASKAAGLAWGATKKQLVPAPESSDSDLRKDNEFRQRLSSEDASRKIGQQKAASPFSSDYIPSSSWREPTYPDLAPSPGFSSSHIDSAAAAASKSLTADASSKPPPTAPKPTIKSLPPPRYPTYRKEYLSHPVPVTTERNVRTPPLNRSTSARQTPTVSSSTGETSEQPARKPLPKSQSTPRALSSTGANRASISSISGDEPARPPPRRADASFDGAAASAGRKPKPPAPRRKPRITPPSSDQDSAGEESSSERGDEDPKLRDIMKKLPRGLDVNAARQILNDIVVRGDEVHWDDVAGLEIAKKALKEAVVYPFLRPDLFMGLREPARGMLLFGPPGTGKTMLARAVATESKSTFFSVSASTLTSKWHGESEKLVRALFGLAKALAPSIIFVDEIDSLLSTRSSGTEHEASRRSKTEFLIQWSDLQRAAAGRNQSTDKSHDGGGDPSRVLVLAATNLPWDIDEAARRRFVRRQYIPLPEDHVRQQQIGHLLSHQTHEMSNEDIEVLVKVTEGTSPYTL